MKINVPEVPTDILIRHVVEHGDREISEFEKVRIYCDLTLQELREIPIEQIGKYAKQIDAVLLQVHSYRPDVIEVGQKRYGFVMNCGTLSTGEYIDLKKLLEEGVLNDKNAVKIMCILFREIEREYNGAYEVVKYRGVSKHLNDTTGKFADLPVMYLKGTLDFFLEWRDTTALSTLKSLRQVMLTKPDLSQLPPHHSRRDGGIITSFIGWLRAIFLRLKN